MPSHVHETQTHIHEAETDNKIDSYTPVTTLDFGGSGGLSTGSQPININKVNKQSLPSMEPFHPQPPVY